MNKPEVMVGLAQSKVSADGLLTDSATREFIRLQLVAFEVFMGKVS
jgi:hypothetical protein